VIRKWNVVGLSNRQYQLAVMRQVSGGRWRNVGLSSIGSTPAASEYSFPASLPIRKGDYIGLISDGVQGIENTQARTFTFEPTLDFADPARKPTFTGDDEYQFNATLKH
jgi:hypothetical protein